MGRQIIIGVPGYWETWANVFTSIADNCQDFLLLLGLNLLAEKSTTNTYALELQEFDPDLARAFTIAGRPWIKHNDIEAIASHKHTLYALSSDVSIETAQQMLRVGHALLKAGGIAIKVESAGVAHSAASWAEFAQSGNLFQLYCAFVTLIKGPEYFYSCGMHNFGLPDAAVYLKLGPKEAADLLNNFNYYQLMEKPEINDGETFSTNINSPQYRLRKEACELYSEDDPFHNPFGRWHISS